MIYLFFKTDATELPVESHGPGRHAFLYLAGAEDSKDTYNDGPVAGSVLGIAICTFNEQHQVTSCNARYSFLTNPDGSMFAEKAEGVVLARSEGQFDLRNAIIVLDPDRDRPGRVCSVQLNGFFASIH